MLVHFKPMLSPWPARFLPQSAARHFLSERSMSSAPPDHTIPVKDRRLELARINRLLLSVNRFIAQGQLNVTLEGYLREKLSLREFKNSSRHLAYHKVIILLFRHRKFGDACGVYDQMTEEGILPSTKIRAKMRGVFIVCTAKFAKQLIQLLKELFKDQNFDESSFRELVALLMDTNFTPDVLDSLFKLFVDSRSAGYAPSSHLISDLVNVQIRAGLMESTEDLLNTYADENDLAAMATASYPYTTMLKAVADTQYSDEKAMDVILERMAHDGVSPDIGIFNALIASEVWRHAYAKAFAIYRTLCHVPVSSTTSITPDAFTFGSLFKALQRINIPRSPRSRKHRQPGNVVPPRELYRDMVSAHLFHTNGKLSRRSEVITPSVLNVAMRTFLTARDYAAAFVVVRSFTMSNLKPTLPTYVILVNHIIAKVRLEIKAGAAKEAGSWIRMLDINARNKLDDKTIAMIVLRLSGSAKLAKTDRPGPGQRSSPHRTHETPTVAALMDRANSPDAQYDSIPLERILRWAILADVERTAAGGIAAPPISDGVDVSVEGDEAVVNVSSAKKVSQVIGEAKKVMIPGLKGKAEWQGVRRKDTSATSAGLTKSVREMS